jgi:predicted PurR-regulated permease PerM
LLLVLQLHLLPALFAGLLAHLLVKSMAPPLMRLQLRAPASRGLAVLLLFLALVAIIALATSGVVISVRTGADSLPELLRRMAAIIEERRDSWPPWLSNLLPTDAGEFQAAAVDWLREHAGIFQTLGANTGRALTYVLIGTIIGSIIALGMGDPRGGFAPLAQSLLARVARLEESFQRVVFAQVKISAVNTFLTWLYIGVALPVMGIQLPLAKTLIAVTFFCGLLPVIGNLISNTIIVVVSLSHSGQMAAVSLGYLVVVHKLEYFLNARIVGSQIRAQAWEMLIAMLVMEASFGIAGVIAAPIYYAYLKNELGALRLI